MPFTVTVSKTTAGLENTYNSIDTYIAGARHSINESIATGLSNQLINFEFLPSSGKVLAFSVNTEYNVTIKTNSTSSPDNTFILNTNTPIILEGITGSNGLVSSYNELDSNGNLLTTINSLYISNTGTSVCSFFADSAFDPTP
jgi:hypothetical protein